MRHPILALVWEQWRQTWRPLLLGAVATAFYLAWTWLAPSLSKSYLFDTGSAMAVAWLMALSTWMFLFIHGSLRQFQVAFPARMFTLPVRTETLVMAHLGYKMLVAGLFSAAVSGGIQAVFGVDYPVWVPVLISLVCTAWVQAWVCLYTALGAAVGTIVFLVAAAVMACLQLCWLGVVYWDIHGWQDPSITLFIAFTLLSLMLYSAFSRGARPLTSAAFVLLVVFGWCVLYSPDTFLGWIHSSSAAHVSSPSATPHGEPPLNMWYLRVISKRTEWTVERLAAALVTLLTGYLLLTAWMLTLGATVYARGGMIRGNRAMHAPRRRPFLDAFRTTALGAQCWFEWKNSAAWLPKMTALAMLCGTILYFAAEFAHNSSVGYSREAANVLGTQVVITLPLLPLALAFGVGYRLLRWTPGDLAFSATRPVRTAVIARAKLLAGLLAIVCTGLLIVVSIGLMLLFNHHLRVLWVWGSLDAGPMSLMQTSAIFSFLSLWLALWIGLFLGRVSLLITGLASAVFMPIIWFGLLPRHFFDDDLVRAFAAAGCVVLIAIAAAIAHKKGVLRPGSLVLAGILAGLAFLGAFSYMPSSHPLLYLLHHHLAGVIVAIVGTLAPLYWVSLTVHWNRHR